MIDLNHDIEVEFLNNILKYIERSKNSLKILGMSKIKEKVLNDEESKLLDQIKEKGVRLMDFFSTFKKDNLMLYHLV